MLVASGANNNKQHSCVPLQFLPYKKVASEEEHNVHLHCTAPRNINLSLRNWIFLRREGKGKGWTPTTWARRGSSPGCSGGGLCTNRSCLHVFFRFASFACQYFLVSSPAASAILHGGNPDKNRQFGQRFMAWCKSRLRYVQACILHLWFLECHGSFQELFLMMF